MSLPPAPSQQCCDLQAALALDRVPGHDGDRFIGAQVPDENPVHWVAERAPPSGA